jgi:hypothetical protein
MRAATLTRVRAAPPLVLSSAVSEKELTRMGRIDRIKTETEKLKADSGFQI